LGKKQQRVLAEQEIESALSGIRHPLKSLLKNINFLFKAKIFKKTLDKKNKREYNVITR
jgi:hypothetical protein